MRLVKKNVTQAWNIGILKTKIDNECGKFDNILTSSHETLQFYQILTVKDDVNIHWMKGETTKDIDKRRQMTLTSIWNLASHLFAMLYSNFRPVSCVP